MIIENLKKVCGVKVAELASIELFAACSSNLACQQALTNYFWAGSIYYHE